MALAQTRSALPGLPLLLVTARPGKALLYAVSKFFKVELRVESPESPEFVRSQSFHHTKIQGLF